MSMLKNKHFNKLKKMNNIIMQMKLQQKLKEEGERKNISAVALTTNVLLFLFLRGKKEFLFLCFYVTTIFVLLFFLFAFRSFIHS